MKKIFFALALVLTQNVFSQDSIFKRNGEIIASKITEINSSLIKFKKVNNLDGPVYSELKSAVRWIKFENGTVDTINSKAEVIPKVVTQTVQTQTKVQKSSLMYVRGDDELDMAIEMLPASDAKSKMRREYALMKHYKSNQHLANGLGMGIGFAVPVAVTYYAFYSTGRSSYYRDPVPIIVVGALAGAAIRITGQVLMHVNKNKKINARNNIIRIYDGLP